jgi:low temperature requirement protein LtrA
MPIVAGIIVMAVGDELMLAHPTGAASLTTVVVTCGGPILFLLGNQAFKWTTADRPWPPLSHFGGEVLLVLAAAAALIFAWSPLATGVAALTALIATAVWEWFSLNGGWQRWVPWIARNRKIAPDEAAG